VIAGWVNRNQQEVINYLQAENRFLREQLGQRRLRFSDADR
jgi:putative transposase